MLYINNQKERPPRMNKTLAMYLYLLEKTGYKVFPGTSYHDNVPQKSDSKFYTINHYNFAENEIVYHNDNFWYFDGYHVYRIGVHERDHETILFEKGVCLCSDCRAQNLENPQIKELNAELDEIRKNPPDIKMTALEDIFEPVVEHLEEQLKVWEKRELNKDYRAEFFVDGIQNTIFAIEEEQLELI